MCERDREKGREMTKEENGIETTSSILFIYYYLKKYYYFKILKLGSNMGP